jgi:hypothetical protein
MSWYPIDKSRHKLVFGSASHFTNNNINNSPTIAAIHVVPASKAPWALSRSMPLTAQWDGILSKKELAAYELVPVSSYCSMLGVDRV